MHRRDDITAKNPPPVKQPVRVGVFAGLITADAAIIRLLNAGFAKSEITVVAPASIKAHFQEYQAEVPSGTHNIPAVAAGGAVGAVLGGIIATAAMIGTGGTALLIAGPLVAAASGGAAAGGFIGAMLTRGFEDEAANFYDQALKKGRILVGVHYEGPDQRERLATAERVLAEAGAEPFPLRKG